MKKKVSDNKISSTYESLGSISRVAKILGMSHSGVSKRLRKLGYDTSRLRRESLWTKEQDDILLQEYENYRDRNQLASLAKKIGRSVFAINRRAAKFGLTNKDYNFIMTKERHDILSKGRKRFLENHPEYKSNIGVFSRERVYTTEDCAKRSEIMKSKWKDPNSAYRKGSFLSELKERLSKARYNVKQGYTRGIESNVSFGEKEYRFRSSWERNFAFYMEYIKCKREIKDWYYESEIFSFPQNEYGFKTYKPDFKIVHNDGSVEYIELKGWVNKKALDKMELMARYFPEVKIELYDGDKYNEIKKKYSHLVDWDFTNIRTNVQKQKCRIEGCNKDSRTRGLCKHHYYLWWKEHRNENKLNGNK